MSMISELFLYFDPLGLPSLDNRYLSRKALDRRVLARHRYEVNSLRASISDFEAAVVPESMRNRVVPQEASS